MGVNDIGAGKRNAQQILLDLESIVSKLKQNKPSCKVILFTVPPFDYVGEQEENWRAVNSAIRTNTPTGVDRVFDIASVLSKESPNDNFAKYGGHPDALGCSVVAEIFLKWYSSNT
jgi:lysophospholipase L1-like esterase